MVKAPDPSDARHPEVTCSSLRQAIKAAEFDFNDDEWVGVSDKAKDLITKASRRRKRDRAARETERQRDRETERQLGQGEGLHHQGEQTER